MCFFFFFIFSYNQFHEFFIISMIFFSFFLFLAKFTNFPWIQYFFLIFCALTVWKNEIFTLTGKKFRQINYLVISLVNPLLSRNFCQNIFREINVLLKNFTMNCLTKKLDGAQCGNYGNLLSRIFGKIFVKVTGLLKKLLNSWFDEIFFWWE